MFTSSRCYHWSTWSTVYKWCYKCISEWNAWGHQLSSSLVFFPSLCKRLPSIQDMHGKKNANCCCPSNSNFPHWPPGTKVWERTIQTCPFVFGVLPVFAGTWTRHPSTLTTHLYTVNWSVQHLQPCHERGFWTTLPFGTSWVRAPILHQELGNRDQELGNREPREHEDNGNVHKYQWSES